MAMKTLDSARLLALVAVAREGGFSRAARALGRTQSSISEAVAQLEAELGHKLFSRDARVTKLTPEGRKVLERAERILDEMQAMRADLAATAEAPEGELTVGTTDTLACYLLPPVFHAMRKRHPRVQLRLDNRPSPQIALEVAERRLEVGVISLPLPGELKTAGRRYSERLQIEPLRPLPEVVICARSHSLAKRRSLTAAQLAAHPLLLLDKSTSSRARLDIAFAAEGKTPHVVMEARSVDVLKRLVELNFGVAVVPQLSIERRDAVAAIPLHGVPGEREAGLITPSASPLTPAAKAFAALVRQQLAPRS